MVQSKARTVDQYLKELPPERRAVMETVRAAMKKNLHKDFEECMGYGMPGWVVPHRIFPDGYHCDPRQPLPFAGMAAQKNAYSLYLMCVYMDGELYDKVIDAYRAIGKKPDVGKSCIRFKKLEDIPLDAIAALVKGITPKKYVEIYQAALDTRTKKKKPKQRKV